MQQVVQLPQPPTIEALFKTGRNSFTFLRLLLAVVVLVGHSYDLGGFGADILERISGRTVSLGHVAVLGFFVISGFLIVRSFVHNTDPRAYLWKRVIRIFPGFYVCLAVTVLLFGPFFYWWQRGGLDGYFSLNSGGPIQFLLNNLFLEIKQFGVYGLPSDVTVPGTIIGSLWTLFYEFKAYLLVLVLGVMGWLRKPVVLTLAAGLYLFTLAQRFAPTVAQQLQPFFFSHVYEPELLLYFCMGGLCYFYRERIVISTRGLVVMLAVLGMALMAGGFVVAGPVAWPFILFYLAFYLPFSWLDKLGDWSYGTYLYGFPIQQSLAVAGMTSWGLLPFMMLSIVLSVLAGGLSWVLVEKSTLRFKHRPPLIPTW